MTPKYFGYLVSTCVKLTEEMTDLVESSLLPQVVLGSLILSLEELKSQVMTTNASRVKSIQRHTLSMMVSRLDSMREWMRSCSEVGCVLSRI